MKRYKVTYVYSGRHVYSDYVYADNVCEALDIAQERYPEATIRDAWPA